MKTFNVPYAKGFVDINISGSIINVGVTPLRCHFQHYFFAKK